MNQYLLLLVRENGVRLNITGAAESIRWDEGKGELACRINAGFYNIVFDGTMLSTLLKPGCVLVIFAKSSSYEKYQEVARGRIVDRGFSSSGNGEKVEVTAYDDLFNLQKSEDDRYITKGTGTKSALLSVFSDWGIPLGSYLGPDISHPKTVFKSESLSSIILKLLKTAGEQDGKDYMVRAQSGRVDVLPVGSNSTVYLLDDRNLIQYDGNVSIQDLVTRIKIVGKEDNEERRPVEAVVNGHTEFGIRQQIRTQGEDNLNAARAAAEKQIKEEGEPRYSSSVSAPDIPWLRKGDKIYLRFRALNDYYQVDSISHDAGSGVMTIDLGKKLTGTGEDRKKISTARSMEYQKEDRVILNGYVYRDSFGNGRGKYYSNKVFRITLKLELSRSCPYHLEGAGWVKPEDIMPA